MSFVFKDRSVRRLFLAALTAFTIQLPFLTLMNVAGIHSALGGVWSLFYLPGIWLLDKIGVPAQPRVSRFVETVEVIVIQEIILLFVILPVIAIYARFRSSKEASVE